MYRTYYSSVFADSNPSSRLCSLTSARGMHVSKIHNPSVIISYELARYSVENHLDQ